MGIKHSKTSNIQSTADPSLVGPADWNADHAISSPLNLTGIAVSADSNFTVSGLTSGNCVQAGTGGSLTTISAPCNQSSALQSPVSGPNPLAFDVDLHFKGPNPYVDITRFGARPIDTTVAPAIPGITVTCTSGSPNVTISSASTFQNGDGVVLYGCGSDTIAAPTAPTVTPSLATAQTGLQLDVPGPVGSTTYCYQLVARSLLGATNVGPEACTTTGPASLGLQTNSITSVSLSNTVATYVTSTVHGLAAGAHVVITGVTPPLGSDTSLNPFIGWFTVATVPDNTHFTINLLVDSRDGAITAGTGGTLNYWNCIKIAATELTNNFQYYVYGRVSGGTKTLIGIMWPQNHTLQTLNDPTYLVLDDFGSPVTGVDRVPFYIPNTVPTSATNGMLATTIVSGAGTAALTLAANAGNTISGQTILFDDAVTLLAAATYATSTGTNGPLLIPDSGTGAGHNLFVFNSPIALGTGPTTSVTVVQVGRITINEPIALSTVSWYGWPTSRMACNAFSFGCRATINVQRASPGFYATNDVFFRDVSINALTANGATLYIQDQGGTPVTAVFRDVDVNVDFGTHNSNIGLLFRGSSASLFSDNLSILGNQNGTLISTGPGAYFNNTGDPIMKGLNFSGLGLALRPSAFGGLIKADNVYTQASFIPLFSVVGAPVGGSFVRVYIRGVTRDTTAPYIPVLAVYGTGISATVDIQGAVPKAGPVVMGSSGVSTQARFTLSLSDSSNDATSPQNVATSKLNEIYNVNDGIFGLNAYMGVDIYQRSIAVGPAFSLFSTTGLYPAPTCPVSAGGSAPVGTHTYTFAPIFANGSEGQLSFGCSATLSTGNQTATISWSAVQGVTQYNVYRDQSAVFGSPVTGTTLVDNTNLAGPGPIGKTAVGGPAGMQGPKIWAQTMQVGDRSTITSGSGAPAGGLCTTTTGGKLYLRTDGTTTTTFYVCDGTTGTWTAK